MTYIFLIVCCSALFVQNVISQVIPTSVVGASTAVNNAIDLSNIGYFANSGLSAIGNTDVATISNTGLLAGSNIAAVGGLSGLDVVASGPIVVTSISPIGPSGLAVASENVIEGILNVSGQLPYLSAVAFEGTLPTSGSGVATCGCGSGNVGIIA
ncbi:unnamed protein product [Diatraea saccharalis]|uniref:Uncharacterized protein n=1 Tax=Diatraea saccharalis TaxID=40085 RepID=A0A9N9QWH1_9NEOP|nr:unnamed protein product [Diatraea saccharalis]